jgi:predicted DNA-binding transcriptional regulator AlpA
MKLLKTKEVLESTGIGSRSSLWRAVRGGHFPAPRVISANRICWFASEIEDWAKSLPTRSYGSCRARLTLKDSSSTEDQSLGFATGGQHE